MQLGQHRWRGPIDTFGGKVRGDERMPYDEGARWVVEHWNRLQFDDGSWRRITDYAAKRGFNMIQLDLAEGVRYPSHPELAVDDSWSRETSKNPRPWNPARSKASDDFFRERIDSSGVDAYTNRLN